MKFSYFIIVLILQIKFFHLNNIKNRKDKLSNTNNLIMTNSIKEVKNQSSNKQTSYIMIKNHQDLISQKDIDEKNEVLNQNPNFIEIKSNSKQKNYNSVRNSNSSTNENHKTKSSFQENKNFDIKSKSKLLNNIILNTQKEHIINIKSIISDVTIHSDSPDGYVNEKVSFEFGIGKFNKIIKKFSLGGTSDKLHSFRLMTSDVKLTTAKIYNDCYENSAYYEHSYICVIAYIEDVYNTDNKNKTIDISYEYVSENFIRKREKPFSNKEKENNIILIYDNSKQNFNIEYLSLRIHFQNIIDINKIVAYPEKFSSKTEMHDTYTNIIWDKQLIKAKEFKNFALNMPLFMDDCREMNEFHLEISTYYIILGFITFILIVSFSIIVFPIFINKCKNSYD